MFFVFTQANKIALETKKLLVDSNRVEISQAVFEETLFNALRAKGFGYEYIRRYKMIRQFNHLRQPLVILIGGAPWTGGWGREALAGGYVSGKALFTRQASGDLQICHWVSKLSVEPATLFDLPLQLFIIYPHHYPSFSQASRPSRSSWPRGSTCPM